MNKSDADAFVMISGLVSFISLIVFFVAASNIGAIKRTLIAMNERDDEPNYSTVFELGELREYQGKVAEALDCYSEAYYRLSKLEVKGELEASNAEIIKGKIKSLGGSVKEVSA